ncbi:MAG: CotH kinase family protein [Ignavibacteriae bacterium]|nr:CotH kinase family protein [Ignavibacteriota bacterium]
MIKKVLPILFFTQILISNYHSQNNVIINEVVSSNLNGLINLENGEYIDWIELYNNTDSLADISGYFLTDDISDSAKWQFPANTLIDSNSYLIIYADDKNYSLHTNFKLDADGESIYLFSSNLEFVDSVKFDKQKVDISLGRKSDSNKVWIYFAEPTPGKNNLGYGVKENQISDLPKLSKLSGFFSTEIIIEISSQNNSPIYYTLDGSIPKINDSLLYFGPITIDSTTTITAIALDTNKLPSKTVSQTYFINENTELPVMSIVTDPKNFYDDNIGIYTIGTNGFYLWGVKANYWQEWERPVNIEFFENDKSLAFKVNAGIAINGARRNMLQKSFRVQMRENYGDEFIDYKIFPEKEIRKFSSLVLRNGGFPEYTYTHFRDGFIQNLLSENMDLDYQSYRPCVLYVNGKYWGIYNIREKQNEEYLKDNNGVDPNNLDILENNMIVVEGDDVHYKNIINFLEVNDLSVQSNFDTVKNWIDVDNFIDYQIAQLYISNLDWPANNIKYWRPKTNDGKWRWLIYDCDGGFGLWSSIDFNSITYATEANSTDWNNKPWSTFLFRKLLENSIFKNEFSQRFAAHLSFSFIPSKTKLLINKFQNNIENEIPKHINRWLPDCSPSNPESIDGCVFSTIAEWKSNIQILRNFADQRNYYLYKYLMEYFSISDTAKFVVQTNDLDGGIVKINGVNTEYDIEAKLFANRKVRLEAIPNPGYKFVEWKGLINSTNMYVETILKSDNNIQAIFTSVENLSVIPTHITTNFELEKEKSPYTAIGDVYINENSTLDVFEGVEIRMSENSNIYVFGALNIYGTITDKVRISSLSDKKWGAIIFDNAKLKSYISHTIISGTSHGKDVIDEIGGISSYNSDIELNQVELENVQFPVFVQYGNFVMRNSKIQTDVTSDLVNIKYGSAIIENSEFTGNYSIDTDAIDYDDVKGGIIRRNIIRDFHAENSDAIDIGEGAQNVLVEENFIYNCFDKAISIGQASSALVKGNIIVNCNMGVGVKDEDSYGFIDHNTFYNNNISVACYEKTLGRGGGKADITNSIFSKSKISDLSADEFSEIRTTFSLSDKQLLDGEGNLFNDPNFINPDSLDFRVSENSPVINNGDPNYEENPDGSRTNIGASFYDFSNSNNLVITEINYNSNEIFDSKDWVEIFNPNNDKRDISNWILKDGEKDHIFFFPKGTTIEPKGYLIICEDTLKFLAKYPKIINYIGNLNFGFSNSGEKIRLFDPLGNIIDSLTYDDEMPWPNKADGEGFTLQLTNYELDNSLATNWVTTHLYGTPGELNDLTDVENFKNTLPAKFKLYQNYPNPFNAQTTIKFDIPKTSEVQLRIFDILGREIKLLLNKKIVAGSYTINFDAEFLSSGIYFYQILTDDFNKVSKMILLK